MIIARRTLLLAGVTVGLWGGGGKLSESAVTRTGPRPLHIQVTAHPDDDILFMNPDLASGIQYGQSTVGIYLTGGEADTREPARYAAERQEGTRASYALMASAANEWDRKAIPVGNRYVELNELRANHDVKLVFLNLPEHNNSAAAGSLSMLVNRPHSGVRSLVTAHGTVRHSFGYNKSDVLAVLMTLFEMFQPTTLRLQDAQPDSRYQEGWDGFHNHPDHVSGARLAREAIDRYLTRPSRNATVIDYRDYNVSDAAINLNTTDRMRKKDYFAAYAKHDALAGLGGVYTEWTDRTYYRWPRGGAWAARDHRGEVHAFAVQGPELVHWIRRGNGRWQTRSRALSKSLLRPTLTLVPGSRGNLILLAQTLVGQRLVLKRQLDSGEWPADWHDLGKPSGPLVGLSTGALDADGSLVVAVRNPGGGVSVRRQRPDSSWDEWTPLEGDGVQDDVSIALGPDERMHAFATTSNGIMHWRDEPNGEFTLVDEKFGGIRPAGGPVTVKAEGDVRLLTRTAGDGDIAVLPLGDGAAPTFMPNPGGLSTPTISAQSTPVLVVRNSAGGVSVARTGEPWVELGGQVLDHPAVIVELSGATTVVAAGVDGDLAVNEQLTDTLNLTFSGWRPAIGQEPADVRADGGTS